MYNRYIRTYTCKIYLLWLVFDFVTYGNNTNPDIFAVTIVTCSTFVSTLQPRSDWQSARIHCNDNYSGSILGKEAPKLLLNHVTSYEPGEYLWTNKYHGLSPWIIYKGEISLEKAGCFVSFFLIKKPPCFNLNTLYGTVPWLICNYSLCISVCGCDVRACVFFDEYMYFFFRNISPISPTPSTNHILWLRAFK